MPSFKVVMLGACSVGKTSIVRSYLLNNIHTDPPWATIGAAYFEFGLVRGHLVHPAQTHHDHHLTVGLWDTAGQERYTSLLPMYYRHADVAIVVHDGSLDSITTAETLVREVRANVDRIDIMLVHNKSDLHPLNQKLIDRIQPARHGYTCTIRKEDNSVARLMDSVAEMLLQRTVRPQTPSVVVTEQKNKKCCFTSS